MSAVKFSESGRTISRDPNLTLYSMYANGNAPLSGGGGTYIGRVWQQSGIWYAAPALNPLTGMGWMLFDAEYSQAVGGFRNRREACLYAYGVTRAVKQMKTVLVGE